MPLVRVLFKVDPAAPALHLYRIEAVDGRKWKQTLRFLSAADTDPAMSFNVTDEWRLSEFKFHREIRDTVVMLHKIGCQRIEVTW